ncbi:MAG: exodeoxyribonuclease VII small subunit [Lachnospiraceae bacterium]|nr:exodeoxyribonuclease VII small subunit [Lachnospiraceae bacterium]
MSDEKFTVEKAFEQLDEIVAKLEKEDTTLADALSLYTEGVSLVTKCQKSLDAVEKELIILEKGEER